LSTYIDHLPNPSDDDRIMQLTRKTPEVYAFIENDLADAIAVLPSKSEHAAAEKEELLKVPLMLC
jgi:hypothetical protein